MKRERQPPKTWRRNLLAGGGLLLILDVGILSATPDLAREVLAVVVTVLVGGFIAVFWRANLRLEKTAAEKKGSGR